MKISHRDFKQFFQGQNLNAGGPPEPLSSVIILGMHITNSRNDCISFTYLPLIHRINVVLPRQCLGLFTVKSKPNDFIQTMVSVTTYADSQNLLSGLAYSTAYLVYPVQIRCATSTSNSIYIFSPLPPNLLLLTLVPLSVKSP